MHHSDHKKSGRRRRVHSALIATLLMAVGVIIWQYTAPTPTPPQIPPGKTLPVYTPATLARYNGISTDLPIYIALDGYVYDVTAGREFYVPGGTYHFIAGKDASQEFRVFGGDIIREKYPIVGTFVAS